MTGSVAKLVHILGHLLQIDIASSQLLQRQYLTDRLLSSSMSSLLSLAVRTLLCRTLLPQHTVHTVYSGGLTTCVPYLQAGPKQ